MSKDELDLENLQRELDEYTMPTGAPTPDHAGQKEDKGETGDDKTGVEATAPGPTPAKPVELDDAMIALAEQSAKTPWYANWVTGAFIPGAPALALLMGIVGGSAMLIDWSSLAIILLFIFGPVIGTIWLALFLGHRGRVKYIRQAIRVQSAWTLNGPLDSLGRRTILVASRAIDTAHHFRIPYSARTGQCTVVFADGDVGAEHDSGNAGRGQVITITGPDGREIYPLTGAVPTLFHVPTFIASILFSLAFTAACNAQSQTYSDAAARLRDIDAATQCTATNKPGDDCWNWVPGTVAYEGYYTTTNLNGSTSSTCRSVLRWGDKRQEGDLRIDGIDCTKQLSAGPLPARLQVLRDYAIQVQVGQSIYKTDRWPPLGQSAFTLALVTRLASILWVAWPIVHIVASIIYRLRRNVSSPPVDTPSPPVAEPV